MERLAIIAIMLEDQNVEEGIRLMIDPQVQVIKWIKQKEPGNIDVVQLTQKNWLKIAGITKSYFRNKESQNDT